MRTRPRIYDAFLEEHLSTHRQMAFVSGPRQVGKTTTCRNHSNTYLNWDNADDRERILAGPGALVGELGLDQLRSERPVALFDELHKYPGWKQFLKGLFDSHGDRARILVTGSSRMAIYQRGGDSLMGRYFLYRMHPFSVAEILHKALPDPKKIVRTQAKIRPSDFTALWGQGGFPEPYFKRDDRFRLRWQRTRFDQLVREDIREFTQIQQLAQLESLAKLLRERSAHQLIYSNLAKDVRVTVDTVRRWIDSLQELHLGFLVRPYHKNISRSLRKEPKWFLRDWSTITDPGSRAETFVGCQLLKAVEGWSDLGLGEFELGYLRDTQRREVDFIVVRDGKPWFLVEVKHGDAAMSKHLSIFQEQTKAPFAFQVVIEADYVDEDCFGKPGGPIKVPAKTFLSQLL